MSINVLLTLVEQYKEAAQLIEAAQAEQEQLKIQIREALAPLWLRLLASVRMYF